MFRKNQQSCRCYTLPETAQSLAGFHILFLQKVLNFLFLKIIEFWFYIDTLNTSNKPAKSHGLLLNISVLPHLLKQKCSTLIKSCRMWRLSSEVFYFKFINITLMFRATKTDSILFCPSMDIWDRFFGPEEMLGWAVL